jgi:hypothetical protein
VAEYTDLDGGTLLPALIATGVWLGVGAGLDVYLVTHKKHVITDVLRTAPGTLFLAVLCLHVANVLGKADPFRAAAAALTKKQVAAVAAAAVAIPALSDALTGE